MDSFFKYRLQTAITVFTVVAVFLSLIHLKLSKPMLLLERFFPDFGAWISVILFSFYGAFLIYQMLDSTKTATYRNISWLIFSVFFFSQFLLGLFVDDRFLMSGKLHLPIPMIILAGPLFRWEIGFMTILFLSTIILSGPAWCSQLCYFGALDNAMSGKGKIVKKSISKLPFKTTGLSIVILSALFLRFLNIPLQIVAVLSISFGLIGLIIILFISPKKKKMIHCTLYCPIGTIVNITSKIHPFQMYIDDACNSCLKCTSFCKYDALDLKNIKNHKPSYSCTLCGDCIQSCHSQSIKYKFFNFSSANARTIYLATSISLHAIFMALARL